MATINIQNLSLTGRDLFADSESYLDQLSETDALSVHGGLDPLIYKVSLYRTTTSPTTSPLILIPKLEVEAVVIAVV
ncbi:MAG TPA: hypothetical protein VK203_00090 [Nostocaceae cyanobacterium]|nr:hypothetical protein [Nostocaceae cyanobacterium]